MKVPLPTAARRAGPPPRRVPAVVWVVLAVVVFHAAAFWLLADKHFVPKTRYIAPLPPANFGVSQQTRVDPRTGEVTTEREYVVSTRLASPAPTPPPFRPPPLPF